MLCSANITTFLLVISVACRTRSRRHYHAIKEQKRCEFAEAAHIQNRICSEPWCKLLMNDGLCNLWKADTMENSKNRSKLGIHPLAKRRKKNT
jgi:predicted metal-binding protein